MDDAEPSGAKLQELRLVATRAEIILAAIQDALAITGGSLTSLSIRPSGRGHEGAARFAGVSDVAAAKVCERAADRPGVQLARVEHLWVRS